MTQKIKDWIEPEIKDLGEAKDLIKGGAPGRRPQNIWIRRSICC